MSANRELEDMVLLIPDSSIDSKNVSPERRAETCMTIENSCKKYKVEKVRVRQNPIKKQSCKEVVGPRLDVITRKQVQFRQSFNTRVDIADVTTRTSSATYKGH